MGTHAQVLKLFFFRKTSKLSLRESENASLQTRLFSFASFFVEKVGYWFSIKYRGEFQYIEMKEKLKIRFSYQMQSSQWKLLVREGVLK